MGSFSYYSDGARSLVDINAVKTFLAIDVIDEPFKAKVGDNTPLSDTYSRNLIETWLNDGLLEEVDRKTHKKILAFTDEGESIRDAFIDMGFDPDNALI